MGAVTEPPSTCDDQVREHTWKRPPHDLVRDLRRPRRTLLFVCTTCGLYGWAPLSMPTRVRAYVGDRGERYVPKAEAPPTAVPSTERKASELPKHLAPGDVDRRRA